MRKTEFKPKWGRRRRDDRLHEPSKLTGLPAKVDLRRKVSARQWPVWDQQPYSSCTAHAAAGVALYAKIRAKRRPLFQPSRLFLYHCEQALMKDDHQNKPGDIGTVGYALRTLNMRGMCVDAPSRGMPKSAVWQYTEPLGKKPREACFKFAARNRMPEATFYLRNELDHLRGRLAEGHPFTICIAYYDSFNLETTTKTGDVPLPPVSPMPSPPPIPPATTSIPPAPDAQTGCHAMVVVGYDDARRVFLVRNSFGRTWGKRGYGTIPYKYVLDPSLCDPNSFWTLRLEAD